jgi:MFS superfamily sulfate permease-like transporter
MTEAESSVEAQDHTPRNMFRHDGPAGSVVFLIALPLCLGIALASNAPLIGGIIAGIVGGIVVGALSGSDVSVSGPTAGLAVIVAATIQETGSYRAFLMAVVLSGVLQIAFGALKFGVSANYVPNSVIKGMTCGVGALIVLKQIPHMLGRDTSYMEDQSVLEWSGNDTLKDLLSSVIGASPGAVIISAASVLLLLIWGRLGKVSRVFRMVPGQLGVVVLGIGLNQVFGVVAPALKIVKTEHVVNLPSSLQEFSAQFTVPDFSAIADRRIWMAAFTIAVGGSLITLLSLEAADRLDPHRRISPPNRELRAHGIGNIVSGLLGGLPLASVLVRSAANVDAGAHTKMSAIVHGVLLLLAVMLLPGPLRYMPLASLATILAVVSFKLTRPALYREVYAQGWDQFIPFLVTVLAVVFTNLLLGMFVGWACGLFFVIRANHHESITMVNQDKEYLIRFTKDASFINKNEFRQKLSEVPNGSHVLIDGARALFIDHDIRETLEDFRRLAPYKEIQVEVKGWKEAHGTP